MSKQIICTVCPMGCQLQITESPAGFQVTGNSCPRGEVYGIQEMTDPRRTVTSTVKVTGGDHPLVSVKTSRTVPKDRMFDVIRAISEVTIPAPVRAGDILIGNILGLEADIVATRAISKAEEECPEEKKTGD